MFAVVLQWLLENMYTENFMEVFCMPATQQHSYVAVAQFENIEVGSTSILQVAGMQRMILAQRKDALLQSKILVMCLFVTSGYHTLQAEALIAL